MVYLAMDGEQVRSLREQRGMSQRELAEAASVSKRTVTNVEAGKVYSQVSTARKIGAALDVNPRTFARAISRRPS
jgi:transcriptional regulator with XRE-family HTH domain